MLRYNQGGFTHNGTGGTGTLTLAHVTGLPDPFQVWGGAQPTGFSATHIVPYTINEFTDSTFAQLLQTETGFGTLVIGANIGATTLARTTKTSSWVDGSPGTYTPGNASAVNFGNTAANIQIILGPEVTSAVQLNPYFEQTLGDALGMTPVGIGTAGTVAPPASGSDNYIPFKLETPLLVKRASVAVAVAGSGTTNLYIRIYEWGTNGRPGRLLIDLGVAGTAGSSLNSIAKISTALATNGLWLTPGWYYLDIYATYSGSPTMFTGPTGPICSALGSVSGVAATHYTATTGSQPGPDPANVTSIALVLGNIPGFWLNNQ